MGTNTREMCVASQKINVHFVDEPAKIVILTSIFGETLLREREREKAFHFDSNNLALLRHCLTIGHDH